MGIAQNADRDRIITIGPPVGIKNEITHYLYTPVKIIIYNSLIYYRKKKMQGGNAAV